MAKLAKELADPDQEEIQVTIRNRRVLSSCFNNDELQKKHLVREATLAASKNDLKEPFIKYLKYGELPEDKSLAM